jgi:hypothetical protein
MVEWARDHGIRVKTKAKASSIREAICDAGLELPEEFWDADS